MNKTLVKFKKIWNHKTFQNTLMAVVAVVIFGFGVLVGEGRISIGNSNSYHSENPNLPNSLSFSSVNQVYDIIRDNYDGHLTQSQLLDGLKTGLAQSTGDPYTEYFNPTQAASFNNELSDTFGGIGAQLGQNGQGQLILSAPPIAGFAAAKAGLESGDAITSINGKSTVGLSLDSAVDDIRGPSGTKVTLGITRNDIERLIFSITRDNVTVPSVTTSILPDKIGDMVISQFTGNTAKLAQQAAQQFTAAHVSGIILDLRDNPGGLLNAATSLSSLWVPQGKVILQEKRGSQVVKTYTAGGGDVLNGIPTVVLINGGSASASEITAGALHDNGVAHLIGVKSYGKGVVQELFNLNGGGELKVTVASWYRPDGQNINKIGITPDQIVNMPTGNTSNDPQQSAAITWIEQH